MLTGWTGSDCNTPDCPGGCAGKGYCDGINRDVPVCLCKDVSIELINVNGKRALYEYVVGKYHILIIDSLMIYLFVICSYDM